MLNTMIKKSPFLCFTGFLGLLIISSLSACSEAETAPEQYLHESLGNVGRFERYTASIEVPEIDSGTRVYVDGSMNVRWESGDRISIFNGTSENQEF